VIAHVGGVPVEELLPALAGSGTALLIVRARVTMLRRRVRRGPRR
jgi:hypothetical protein